MGRAGAQSLGVMSKGCLVGNKARAWKSQAVEKSTHSALSSRVSLPLLPSTPAGEGACILSARAEGTPALPPLTLSVPNPHSFFTSGLSNCNFLEQTGEEAEGSPRTSFRVPRTQLKHPLHPTVPH